MGTKVPSDMLKVRESLTRLEPPLTMADKAAGLLRSTFAQFTLAGLAVSAIQKAVGSLGEFVAQGSKLPGLEQSFHRLSVGLGQDSGAMLANMSAATRGLVSNYDLMTSANKAMLLGLPVTSASMGDLAKTATTLGRAMGIDATQSLNDLIVALGRSSPLILDNLGLTVKVGEANEAYAEKMKIVGRELTDAEKKLAFYDAAMAAAARKVAQLGEQTRTFGEIMQSVWVKVGNTVTTGASILNVEIGAAIENLRRNAIKYSADVSRLGIIGANQIQQLRKDEETMLKLAAEHAGKRYAIPAQLEKEAEAHKAVAKATGEHTRAATANAVAIQQLASKYDGSGLSKQVKDLAEAMRGLKADANFKLLAEDIGKLFQQGAKLTPEMLQLALSFGTLSPGLNKAAINFKELGQQVSFTVPEMDKIWRSIDKLLPDPKVVGISNLSTAFAALVVRSPADMLKDVAVKIRDVGERFHGASQALGKVGDVLGFIPGKMAAIAGEAVKTAEVVMGKLASGDVWGAVIAAAASAVKLVTGLWTKFFGTAGRDLVQQFADSLGGFDAMHAKLLTLGASGEALWVKLTQGVGRNNPEQAKKVIEEINAALAGQDGWMTRLPGLIDKYGLSWQDAGIKAKQAHLDDIAKGLIQDFADLSKAGFDVSLITEKMSVAVNAYAQDARLMGAEIPESMKPLLLKMIEMGTLTDAAGNKLTDLEGLSFAKTLTENFKGIEDAIRELTKALLGELGGALDDLAKRKVRIPVGFDVDPLPTGHQPEGAASGGLVGYGRILPFSSGGTVPAGTDTVPAMLTPGEIVINAAQQRNIAGSVGGGNVFDLSKLAAAQERTERLLRDQPRAIAVAVQDAFALAVKRR